MVIIDDILLDDVSAKAVEGPRLRMNFNFHATMDAKAQKLLNALEPGTELPIHRHLHTSESYILLRGKIRVLVYNEAKELLETIELNPLEGNYGVDIPAGEWHTLEVLEPGTVIFEVKDGPYTPLTAEDILK